MRASPPYLSYLIRATLSATAARAELSAGLPACRAPDEDIAMTWRTGLGEARPARRELLLLATVSLLALSACTRQPEAAPNPATGSRYVLFNQRWLEAQSISEVDLAHPEDLFRHVFAALPAEVTVYPTENYFYFIAHVGGREVWGNLRLAAGSRENGVLSFGYFEFIEFPIGNEQRIQGSKFFTDADGVLVKEIDRFTYRVTFRGKSVTFHLNQLDQSKPTRPVISRDEVFIQRTFDESGYRFYLLFNERSNHFLWVLNEEQGVADKLDEIAPGLLVGRRSGFAFYVDPSTGNRKVLLGVRQLNVNRNDYFDGPFDQLADNYAQETRVAEYMVRAFPALAGRIDRYGYYTDRQQPLRVALSTYFVYLARSDLVTFLERMKVQDDPLGFISRGGRTETATSGGGN